VARAERSPGLRGERILSDDFAVPTPGLEVLRDEPAAAGAVRGLDDQRIPKADAPAPTSR